MKVIVVSHGSYARGLVDTVQMIGRETGRPGSIWTGAGRICGYFKREDQTKY